MGNKEISIEEYEFMKSKVNELEEKLELYEKRLNEMEEQELGKKISINRKVLDANVISIYNQMRERDNSNKLLFSSIMFMVTILLAAYFLKNCDDISYAMAALLFAFIALSAVITSTLGSFWYSFKKGIERRKKKKMEKKENEK